MKLFFLFCIFLKIFVWQFYFDSPTEHYLFCIKREILFINTCHLVCNKCLGLLINVIQMVT